MRVLILTHGTRGDVQPFVALARALETAGHEPVLGAPETFGPFVEAYGLRFAPLDEGPNRLLDDPELLGAFTAPDPEGRGGRHRGQAREISAMLRAMRESKPAMVRVLADMAEAASGGADLVVHAAAYPAHHIAERLGVPAVPVALQPVWVPTSAFPNPMLPVGVPAAWNRATYRLNALALRSFAGVVDRWRRDTLGLPPRPGRHDMLRRPDGSPAPLHHAFSRHLVPEPADYPEWVHTTGYWFLPAQPGWEPPRELADFLAAGEPPVFVGFSSMPSSDPGRMGRMIRQAVRRAGSRVVLATGWGGVALDGSADDVLLVRQVPHDWLLPRVAAAVHAGGAGTTGAALAAGRPQVLCPFHAEQRFWARRAWTVGVAPEPIPARRLTADALAGAIRRAVTDEAMARRAGELGELVGGEDGVGRAVKLLEGEVAGRR